MVPKHKRADMLAAIDNAQAAMVLAIPQNDRSMLQCVAEASTEQLEDMMLAMLVNIARLSPKYDAATHDADVDTQIRIGASLMNDAVAAYFADQITH